ncbi:hypothetical protein [Listeria booriae]|uniref:hypothetical protein n=1 Tax=Listeria booriae TaxID=1552123 RepID=UPI00162960E0|nr:hypothetical protein [Listeria booriae]MBC1513570.1 hypothetical protein [Listeria booriae]MBC6152557.1 hypothetical protein [Listeria booriae]MBC6306846.1 hypothetical protein [Listeria booriae]
MLPAFSFYYLEYNSIYSLIVSHKIAVNNFNSKKAATKDRRDYCKELALEYLCYYILGVNHKITLEKNSYGAPILSDGAPYYLSISHSASYTMVSISQFRFFGVDIESYTPSASLIEKMPINSLDRKKSDFIFRVFWSVCECLVKITNDSFKSIFKNCKINFIRNNFVNISYSDNQYSGFVTIFKNNCLVILQRG